MKWVMVVLLAGCGSTPEHMEVVYPDDPLREIIKVVALGSMEINTLNTLEAEIWDKAFDVLPGDVVDINIVYRQRTGRAQLRACLYVCDDDGEQVTWYPCVFSVPAGDDDWVSIESSGEMPARSAHAQLQVYQAGNAVTEIDSVVLTLHRWE